MQTRRAAGFTLVELLIVVTIIVILMGLLLPTLSRLDMATKETACQRNLKEVHRAFMAYATQYNGLFPYPVDTYYGRYFSGTWTPKDPWAGLSQLRDLKRVGLEARTMFCPLDPACNDWDGWPQSTWKSPYHAKDATTSTVYFGYAIFTWRGYPYGSGGFSNGRGAPTTVNSYEATPIAADALFTRASGQIKWGWHHGGGLPEGLFNADCNTVFLSGEVVWTSREAFDWDNPSFTIGSCTDLWWCALKD